MTTHFISTTTVATKAEQKRAVEAAKESTYGEYTARAVPTPEPEKSLTPEELLSVAKANVNQAVGIVLADGRNFSSKILEVIDRPGRAAQLLLKGWAYESGDFNPFAVVKYPAAQVTDLEPFADNAFLAVV